MLFSPPAQLSKAGGFARLANLEVGEDSAKTIPQIKEEGGSTLTMNNSYDVISFLKMTDLHITIT